MLSTFSNIINNNNEIQYGIDNIDNVLFNNIMALLDFDYEISDLNILSQGRELNANAKSFEPIDYLNLNIFMQGHELNPTAQSFEPVNMYLQVQHEDQIDVDTDTETETDTESVYNDELINENNIISLIHTHFVQSFYNNNDNEVYDINENNLLQIESLINY